MAHNSDQLTEITVKRTITVNGLRAGDSVSVSLLPHRSQLNTSNAHLGFHSGVELLDDDVTDLFDNRQQLFKAEGDTAAFTSSFQLRDGQTLVTPTSNCDFPFTYSEALRRELFSVLRVPAAHPPFERWLKDNSPLGATLLEVTAELVAAADSLLTDQADDEGLSDDPRHVCDIFDVPQCTASERAWFIVGLLRYAGIATRLVRGLRVTEGTAWRETWVQVLCADGRWIAVDLATGAPAGDDLVVLRLANSPSMLREVLTDGSPRMVRETIEVIVAEPDTLPAPEAISRWDAINRCALQIDRAFELLGISVHSASGARTLPGNQRPLGGSDWPSIVEALCAPETRATEGRSSDRHIISDGTADEGSSFSTRALGLATATAREFQRRLSLASLFGTAQTATSVPNYPAASLTMPTSQSGIERQIMSMLLNRALLLLNADGSLTGQPNNLANGLASMLQGGEALLARCPNAVWRDLETLTADLNSHHLGFESAWLEPLFSAHFPVLGALHWGQDGEVQVRGFEQGQALECALLPGQDSAQVDRFAIEVNGARLPLHSRDHLTIGVAHLRAGDAPVAIAVIDRWLERPVATGQLDRIQGLLASERTVTAPRSVADRPVEQAAILDFTAPGAIH